MRRIPSPRIDRMFRKSLRTGADITVDASHPTRVVGPLVEVSE